MKGPGVVTGRSGSIGRVHFIEGDFWPLNTALWVKDFHGNDPEWVSYLLQWFDLSRFARGAAVPTLDRNLVHSELVPVPPTDEQPRLVGRIRSCMDRIEEVVDLRRATLHERDVLIDSLIEAKLERRGERYKRLGEVCSITSKLVDPAKHEYQTLLHVGGANIESNTGRLIALKTAAEEELKSGKFVFDRNMVLYNKIRPYLKKVARPDFSGLCSADMYPLSPISDLVTRDYLFYELLSRRFTNYAIAGSNRAGMPKVNRDYLFAYELPLPSLDTQKQIAEQLDEAVSAVLILREEMSEALSETSALRHAILNRAFTGKL